MAVCPPLRPLKVSARAGEGSCLLLALIGCFDLGTVNSCKWHSGHSESEEHDFLSQISCLMHYSGHTDSFSKNKLTTSALPDGSVELLDFSYILTKISHFHLHLDVVCKFYVKDCICMRIWTNFNQ